MQILYFCAKYGRLYNGNTAKTVCPTGWHLPSRDEWGALAKAAGGTGGYGAGGTAGKALKSMSGWKNNSNGTDTYGFSALPGGYSKHNSDFYDAGNEGYWWTATQYGGNNDGSYYRNINGGDGVYEGSSSRDAGFSVRCVAD